MHSYVAWMSAILKYTNNYRFNSLFFAIEQIARYSGMQQRLLLL